MASAFLFGRTELYTYQHTSPVPEPTTYASLAAGLGLQVLARRRKTAGRGGQSEALDLLSARCARRCSNRLISGQS
jgi:hypothetical protein